MFCIYCGVPNPENASYCSACGKSLAVPAPRTTASVPEIRQTPEVGKILEAAQPVFVGLPPTPLKPRSHMLRNITLLAVAVAAVIVAAIRLSGSSPKDSLEKAGAAFAHQNAQSFDNYVDVQSILADWTDQAASGWVANNQESAGDTLIANGLATGFKSLIVPKLASSVEQQILGNHVADQTQSTDSDVATNYVTNFLASGIHSLITSHLTYQGVASQTKSGSDAILDVRVGSPLSNSPFIVKVKMRRVGDRWRIVAIPNVAGLLAQLHPPPNPSLQMGLQRPADAVPSKPGDAAPELPVPVQADPTTGTAPLPSTRAETKIQKPDDDDPVGPGGFITPPTR